MRKSQFIKALNTALDKEVCDHNEYKVLVKALEPHVGKKITKRWQNYLPTGYRLIEGRTYALQIEAPSGNVHPLCRQVEHYDPEKFAINDAPYNRGAKERAEKLVAILNDEDLIKQYLDYYKKVAKIVKLFGELKAEKEIGGFNNPTHFSICSSIVEQNVTNDIYVSDIKSLQNMVY